MNTASNATPVTTGAALANEFERFIGVVEVSTITGAGNVTAYLRASNFANMSSPVNISATNAVGFSNTANTLVTVEARADQLPSTGTSYIQLAIVVAGNSAIVGGQLIGAGARFGPGSQYNNTTVLPTANQIVY